MPSRKIISTKTSHKRDVWMYYYYNTLYNPIVIVRNQDWMKMSGKETHLCVFKVLPSGKQLVKATYRETVLLGKKLGGRVSIKSTSSHTTFTRTRCLLSSLDLSAEQWQLSTIRSGQFLLLRLDSHSATITHSKLSALMVDWDCFKIHAFKLSPSFCD